MRAASEIFAEPTSPPALPPDRARRRRPGPSAAETDLRLLAALYACAASPDGWATFLNALTQCYPAGKGLLGLHDPGQGQSVMKFGAHWAAGELAAYNEHFAPSNPWMQRLGRRPVGRVAPAEFMLPHDDLIRTGFYQDFLRPAGVGSGVGLTVQRDGSRDFVISVLFPYGTPDRDPDTIGRLQRLAPHLLRVAQLDRQLASLALRSTAAEAALDRLATAFLVVDGAGRIVAMNDAAGRLLSAGDGLMARQDRLSATQSAEAESLRRLLAEAARAPRDIAAAPGGALRITRRSGEAQYEVLVAPAAGAGFAQQDGGGFAMVFARDPQARIAAPIDRLRHLYGLTAAEARLMAGLLAGDTLEDIAARHAVGRETVRSQLKAVFQKTGTASQLELLRLGLRGVGAVGG